MEQKGYVGGNVTLPHKEAAFRSAASVTAVARKLEAANTLWLEGGKLHADNTDAHGFIANLDDCAPGWRNGSTALVIGAGGASRAVLYALIEAGFGDIMLLNRTVARAETLAKHFGVSPFTPRGLSGSRIRSQAPTSSLTRARRVCTTGRPSRSRGVLQRGGAIATDLVYVPLVTPFLEGARECGLTIVDGLGMLLHQAVPGFERWFGVRPSGR